MDHRLQQCSPHGAPRVGQGCAPGLGGRAVWGHCRHPDLVRVAPPIRPDMIFGKDNHWLRPGYASIIVRLARRDLVWINVTPHPTADWIARQITEAFPWNRPRARATSRPLARADAALDGEPAAPEAAHIRAGYIFLYVLVGRICIPLALKLA